MHYVARTLVVASLAFVAVLSAGLTRQQPSSPPGQPAAAAATKFEDIASEHGVLTRIDEYTIGNVPALGGDLLGKLTLELVSLTFPQSSRTYYAVRLTYAMSGDRGNPSVGLIEEKEIDSVQAALKYLTEAKGKLDRKASLASTFRFTTQNGVEFGTGVTERAGGDFVTLKGNMILINSLGDLESAVASAKAKLDALRKP